MAPGVSTAGYNQYPVPGSHQGHQLISSGQVTNQNGAINYLHPKELLSTYETLTRANHFYKKSGHGWSGQSAGAALAHACDLKLDRLQQRMTQEVVQFPAG